MKVAMYICSCSEMALDLPKTAAADCLSSELGLDERKRLLTILGAVALVSGLVAAFATVWVSRVAVRLDLCCLSSWALEASRSRGEL